MAINVPLHKNHRIIILLALLFCIFIYPVSASTGTFLWSGTESDEESKGGSTVSYLNDEIGSIIIPNVGTVKYLSSVSWRFNQGQIEGSMPYSSYWVQVNYKIGDDVVGNGAYGYIKDEPNNEVVITALFYNSDFDDYSGKQILVLDWVSESLEIRAKNSFDVPTTSTMAYLGLYADGVKIPATNYYLSNPTNTHYVSYPYSFSNIYEYEWTYNRLYFNLNRDADSKIKAIINNSDREIVNESSYAWSLMATNLEIYESDTTNNTWSIDVENQFDDSQSVNITIKYAPPPLAEDTIEWGADSYVVDDTGSYSWSLSDSNWDTWLYSKKASIYRDETLVHEVSLPNQTGTFYYTFEEEGSFTVKLRHTSALLPHVTIDTDTVIVSVIGESFISVTNATVYINTPIEFQFSYGFTPLPVSPGVWSSATSIEARKLINGDWVPVNRWFYPYLENVTPSVLYTYTIGITGAYSDSMLTSEGAYIFYLTDFNHGDVASTNVYTVEYQSGMPTENITTTYLNILSGETYLFDDLFTFKYGIDNTNFTNGINYIEIYNYDHDIITQSALLFKQSWYKDGYIFPMTDEDPTEQFQYGIIIAFPGNNTMRIRHDDINGSTELVHDNFTLSENNIRGYGLKLSAYEACINEAVTIWVTIPSDSNLTIYSPTGTEIKTYNLNASTTITYYFPVSGQYDLKLVPSGLNYAERTATIYISDCADDGIIEPPSGEIDDMYLNMFNFMTLPIFWGMIIFVGFIGGLSMKTNRNGDHLVSGNGLAFIAFGLLNLLAFIGMLAPYTMYAIVSTWIFAGIFFGVGRYLARGE